MYRLCCLFLSLYVSVGLAATYQIPTDSKTVGEMSVVIAKRGDTLNRIAVRNGVGYNEIVRANPSLSKRKLRVGTQVIVPTAYVLPKIDYQGIVINLSAMRLYYFPDNSTVMTYPVAIGKRGWGTPKATTKVIKKHRHPTWTPPKSIIREAARKGKKLRKVYPAGPNNPLGTRALRLGLRGYLIHGTNKPWTIGKRRSHGCIRMRRSDVEELFEKVAVGTQVRIISQASPLAQLPELSEQAEMEIVADTTPTPIQTPSVENKPYKSYKRKTYRRKNRVVHQPTVVEIEQPVEKIFTDSSLFGKNKTDNKKAVAKSKINFMANQLTDEEKNNRELDSLFSKLSNSEKNSDYLQATPPAPINDNNFSKAI
ncbi:MAG: L,D-transpeptidase family protein, partial [Gammaproteobacteria bacterium]|nr:L,D-transpeptidase family protein [Gammaproteobacteria bacterium]